MTVAVIAGAAYLVVLIVLARVCALNETRWERDEEARRHLSNQHKTS